MIVSWLVVLLFSTLGWSFKLSTKQCTADSPKCLPEEVETAIMSQRDVSYNVSIDRLPALGINLNNAVFNATGITDLGMSALVEVLGTGYRALSLDVFYNANQSHWQLCPVTMPIARNNDPMEVYALDGEKFVCQQNVTLDSVWDLISDFIDQTDTNLSVGMLTLMLNLRDAKQPREYKGQQRTNSNSKLSDSIDGWFKDRIYTPEDLGQDRRNGKTITNAGETDSTNGFPSLHRFLLERKKRVLAVMRNSSLTSLSYNLEDEFKTFFMLDNAKNSTAHFGDRTFEIGYTNNTKCELLKSPNYFFNNVNKTEQLSWRMVLETEDMPFNNSMISEFVSCGYYPVLNTPVSSIDDLTDPVDNSLWTWAPDEPKTISNTTAADGKSQLTAYRCAQFHSSGWKVGNCYEKYYPLCRKKGLAYQWVVGDKLTNYFEAIHSCPDNTQFSVPRTALQQSAARFTVEKWYKQKGKKKDKNKDKRKKKNNDQNTGEGQGPVGPTSDGFPVWIDVNAIATSGCWVTGGPYANCPYHRVPYDRNQVPVLASAAAVAFFLIVLTLALRADRTPLRKNQNRWKRITNKMEQEEYEGVPA